MLKIVNPSPSGKKAKKWYGVFRSREYTPNYTSLILAGLTEMEVKIEHESIEDINFDEGSLIAIPISFTTLAPRSYKIADEFRRRGKNVVLGGVHVWTNPREAMEHADSVVVGEAEGVWKRVIEDFKKGNLQKEYRAPVLKEWRVSPKREIVDAKRFMTVNIVQTSRGCPHNCEFCSVTAYQGRHMRHRPVDDVIEEIRSLKGRALLFLDDNIFGDPVYTKELLERLIPFKKRWVGQAPSYVAHNSKLIELARDSGCSALFIGFESISEKSLEEADKKWNNPDRYTERIKIFHDYGIMLIGSFIFGFDNDDITVFERTVNFAIKNKIELVNFGILTPLPGTRLFERFKAQERITSYDWSKYDGTHVVFMPKQMSAEELQQGFHKSYQRFYTLKSVISAIRDPEFLLPIRFAFWKNYQVINKRQRIVDSVLQNEQLNGFLQKWKYKADSIQCYLTDKKAGAHEFIVRRKEGVVDRLIVPYEKLKIPLKQLKDFKMALADRIRLFTGINVSYS